MKTMSADRIGVPPVAAFSGRLGFTGLRATEAGGDIVQMTFAVRKIRLPL